MSLQLNRWFLSGLVTASLLVPYLTTAKPVSARPQYNVSGRSRYDSYHRDRGYDSDYYKRDYDRDRYYRDSRYRYPSRHRGYSRSARPGFSIILSPNRGSSYIRGGYPSSRYPSRRYYGRSGYGRSGYGYPSRGSQIHFRYGY